MDQRLLGRHDDMVAVPGSTSAETIAAIIADEMAIGVMNNKTTAVRIIPVPGREVGGIIEFGGLLGVHHHAGECFLVDRLLSDVAEEFRHRYIR